MVDRIKEATMGRRNLVSEDRTIDSTNRRPDLVLKKGNVTLIIHITCLLENAIEVIGAARKEKEDKYAEIASELTIGSNGVRIGSIVVGSLSSWDHMNGLVIRKICSQSYDTDHIQYNNFVFSRYLLRSHKPQDSRGRTF